MSGEGLGPRQNREKAQEQDFIEGISALPGLPMIRHVFEVRQKNCRLGQSREIPRILVRRNPPLSESEGFDTFSISAQPFVTQLFTRSRPAGVRRSRLECGRLLL
jgi:hypothetical protein